MFFRELEIKDAEKRKKKSDSDSYTVVFIHDIVRYRMTKAVS